MTKEDYMKLPKEILAELLAAREKQVPVEINKPDTFGSCPYGERCTNPFHDCIGCPGNYGTGGCSITINDSTVI